MPPSRPRSRTLVWALALLVAPRLVAAQQPAPVHRIGVLDTSSPAAAAGRVEAFRQGLRESGLAEGPNLIIEWRFADGKELAVPPLAAELAGRKPEVLVPLSGAGYGELMQATKEIPIVMAGAHARDIAGPLMSYGPNVKELVRQAATYVVRILRGVKPWNLAVEQSRKLELVVNLKTAKALGLTIPPALLARADAVIE